MVNQHRGRIAARSTSCAAVASIALAVGAFANEHVPCRSDTDPPANAVADALAGVRLPADDLHAQDFEAVRELVLQLASTIKGSPLAERGLVEVLPKWDAGSAEQLGPYSGLWLSSAWLEAIDLLLVRSEQCVDTDTAQAIGAEVSAAVDRAITTFDSLPRRATSPPPLSDAERAGLARGRMALAAAIARGDLPVPPDGLSPARIAEYERQVVEQLARRHLQNEEGGERPSLATLVEVSTTSEPSLTAAYNATLAHSPCIEQARERNAGLRAALEGVRRTISSALAADAAELQMRQLRLAAERRRATALRVVREVDHQQARETLKNEARLVLSAIAAAAREAVAQDAARSSWIAVDCALVSAFRGAHPEASAVNVPLAVRLEETSLTVIVGLPLVEVGAPARVLMMAGSELTIPCDPTQPIKLEGSPIACTGCLLEAQDARWSLCQPRPADMSGTYDFKTFRSSRGFGLGVGLSWTRDSVRVVAAPSTQAPEDRLRERALAALAWRALIEPKASLEQEIPAAVPWPARRSPERLLSAELGEFAGTHDHESVWEVLQLPIDSPLRAASEKPASSGEPPFLLLRSDTARLAAQWARERDNGDLIGAANGIELRVRQHLIQEAGLTAAEVSRLIEDLSRSSALQEPSPAVRSVRWGFSAVPLLRQAAQVANLSGEARDQALTGLSWMLRGAADPQPMIAQARQRAWVRGLERFQSELVSRAATGVTSEEIREELQREASAAFNALSWWFACPCFPALNFDPDRAWLDRCAARALTAGDAEIERSAGTQQATAADRASMVHERRSHIHVYLGRLVDALLVEPDGAAAPAGHGAASMPADAQSYIAVYSPTGGITVSIKR